MGSDGMPAAATAKGLQLDATGQEQKKPTPDTEDYMTDVSMSDDEVEAAVAHGTMPAGGPNPLKKGQGQDAQTIQRTRQQRKTKVRGQPAAPTRFTVSTLNLKTTPLNHKA